MTVPQHSSAQQIDLELLKAKHKYEDINSKISKAVAMKFTNHLWYLSEDLATLPVLDSGVKLSAGNGVYKEVRGRTRRTNQQNES